MGTSQSSKGPGAGAPIVPPWTPPPSPEEPPQAEQEPIAPPARFRGARRALGDYARSGDIRDLRRGLSHYVRSGYRGSAVATRRLGGTAATAGSLWGALADIASEEGAAEGSPLDRALSEAHTAEEVMDAMVEAVRPVDGSQDAEAERAAILDALSDLLTQFPEADLLQLDPGQRSFAIERFTAISVFRRFELDVGKTIQTKAPNASTALARLKEVRNYVQQRVAASFRRLRDIGHIFTRGRIDRVVRDALQDTFEVFEAYTE